ncbi:MAG: hypothetical protein H7832_03455 [Magnetococcus sp. DMHC-6]
MKLVMIVTITACMALAIGCSKTEEQPKSAAKSAVQNQEPLTTEAAAPKAQAVVTETTPAQPSATAVEPPAVAQPSATAVEPPAVAQPSATAVEPPAVAQPSATAVEPPAVAHPTVAAVTPTPDAQSPTVAPPSNQGTVKSTQQAGGYTYVEADQNGQIIWLAGPATTVNTGDMIHWEQGAVMHNFFSKTLNRTFPEILFVSAVLPGASPPPPPPMTAKVVSTTQASGYDYLEVDRGDGQPAIWLAAPSSSIKVGDQVSWSGGSQMQNFFSKGLNRTFETIYFVSSVSVVP